tara:strand:- start:46 stop:396 length:351 start_codon:yes stop_codon:yes gene_type:complete
MAKLIKKVKPKAKKGKKSKLHKFAVKTGLIKELKGGKKSKLAVKLGSPPKKMTSKQKKDKAVVMKKKIAAARKKKKGSKLSKPKPKTKQKTILHRQIKSAKKKGVGYWGKKKGKTT